MECVEPMWKVRREIVELYTTLMEILQLAQEPPEVVQIRAEWEALSNAYPNPDASCHKAIEACCRKWKLCDANGVIPTGLFALRCEGKTDLREADFRIWRFEPLDRPELPFHLWVDPRIESKQEFLARAKATLQVEREPQLLEKIHELPASPVVRMEWNASRGEFEPKPAGWLQRAREAWNLPPEFMPDGVLTEMILRVAECYYNHLAKQVGSYVPKTTRTRDEIPNMKRGTRQYYLEMAWVHLLRAVGWRWEPIADWLFRHGIVERERKLTEGYALLLARLRKIPERLRREFWL